jgi:HAD superfamily hydrolase (TIGR01509 family)
MIPEVLFLDFDGLICDTERAARLSWEEFYSRLGLEFPSALWAQMVGRQDGESLAVADLSRRRARAQWQALLSWRRSRKEELADQEPVLPGVIQLMDTAEDLGIRLAVVSSSSAVWVGRHLRRTGLYSRLSFVITREVGRCPKPAPDLYLTALRRAGLEPRAAVAFEDSPPGIRAVAAAGIRCVAVRGPGQAIALPRADLVLDSLDAFDFRWLAT